MQCPQCQHENASDAKFCNQCATPFVPVCSACGHENTADAKLCNQCGTSLIAPTSATSSVQSVQQAVESESRFQALIPAVIGLLQGKRRVTYRTLKYIFSIDESLLEEIREELLLTGLARDEGEKVLVWTGEAGPHVSPTLADPSQSAIIEGTPLPSSAAPVLHPLHTTPDTQSNGSTTSSEPLSTDILPDELITASDHVRSGPEAERRQLTVMFCDLADSTKLSQQLD